MIIYVENPKAIQSLLLFHINFRIKVLPLKESGGTKLGEAGSQGVPGWGEWCSQD